ncbi:unnamed protein product [Fraxinus pennsylvanica]|uniref:GRAM domain-containing protein n=1 Tax=Fraxinus pennsylvanica TaxID=56036 RepID=A0AAD1YSJ7_9LAMI|nr:unnamed protein product [Fraxinus pennsylvanica]
MNPDPNKNPASQTQSQTKPEEAPQPSADYAPYPKLDPKDVTPVTDTWSSSPVGSESHGSGNNNSPRYPSAAEGPAPIYGGGAASMPAESNPYVSSAPVPGSSTSKIKEVLGQWGKKAAEATKKAEDLAGNMWQHLKTGPSLADAAVGRIAQSTKVLTEGGYEKVFRQSFETIPDEKLLKYYACYLSTSAGPVMGVLYYSTVKLAFCSDNPLSYTVDEETRWSYYKVLIPLHQLKAVNPSKSKLNPAEKYIQIISVDNHEFWFMGFLNYDSAVKNIQGALEAHH